MIGHSNFDTGIPMADQARIVTVLREPVSRVKSFLRFAASGKTGLRKAHADRPFSVDEILESESTEISNLQIKHLSNRAGMDWDEGLAKLGVDSALSLAKSRLFTQVHAFGIQDYFEESWVAIWHSLDLRPPAYATRNRTKHELEFTREQEERIRELNQLDLALYEAAKKEFEKRLDTEVYPDEVFNEFLARQKRIGPMITLLLHSTASRCYWTYRKKKRRLIEKLTR